MERFKPSRWPTAEQMAKQYTERWERFTADLYEYDLTLFAGVAVRKLKLV